MKVVQGFVVLGLLEFSEAFAPQSLARALRPQCGLGASRTDGDRRAILSTFVNCATLAGLAAPSFADVKIDPSAVQTTTNGVKFVTVRRPCADRKARGIG